MQFYLLIFFVFSIFSFFEIIGIRDKQQKLVYVFLSVFLFILSFIRWETGTDWDSYYSYFIKVESVDTDEFEQGYAYLNIAIKYILNSYSALLFILACIMFICQSNSIWKYSIYPITSLFILVGISLGNIFFVRQTVAVALLFYSVRYIDSKKYISFLIFVILASLLHRTSWIFIIAYPCYNIICSRKYLFTIVVSSLLFSTTLALLFQNIGPIMGAIVQAKIDLYMNVVDSDDTMGANHSLTMVILKGLANKILVLFLAFFLWNRIEDIRFKKYVNLYVVGAVLYFSTITISVAFVRIALPFDIFQIVIIPFIFVFIKRQTTKIVVFFILTIYLLMRLYMFCNSYYDLYIPYKIFLQ